MACKVRRLLQRQILSIIVLMATRINAEENNEEVSALVGALHYCNTNFVALEPASITQLCLAVLYTLQHNFEKSIENFMQCDALNVLCDIFHQIQDELSGIVVSEERVGDSISLLGFGTRCDATPDSNLNGGKVELPTSVAAPVSSSPSWIYDFPFKCSIIQVRLLSSPSPLSQHCALTQRQQDLFTTRNAALNVLV